MAGLALGVAVVTTAGEDVGARAVDLNEDAPHAFAAAVKGLLGCDTARTQLVGKQSELYQRRFALQHTIALLRGKMHA
jgi:hypothetical protein